MASRQRSFFDQDSKARPRRQRPRISDHAPREPEPCVKPAMPPIPASTESRSKLEAFQFHETPKVSILAPAEAMVKKVEKEEDKENIDIPKDSVTMAASELMPCPPLQTQHQSQCKDCPQTPVGRVPLAELIAEQNDHANQNVQLTPVERVLWHYSPGSSQLTSSQDAPPKKRSRKRARSSSPSSSSQNDASGHHAADKQRIDLQTLRRTLETPQVDPASELWSRYSLKTGDLGNQSPTRDKGNSWANMLSSSSPQAPPSNIRTRDLGGLRRAISCANEWPTSAAKRRKFNHGDSKQRDINDQSAEDRAADKMSRVNFLLEQIENGLLRPHKVSDDAKRPPDYSLSPGNGDPTDDNESSSSRRVQQRDQEPEPSSSKTLEDNEITQEPHQQNNRDIELTSDFGDDDFDDEMMQAVDASFAPERDESPPFATAPDAIVKEDERSLDRPVTSSLNDEVTKLLENADRAHEVHVQPSDGFATASSKQEAPQGFQPEDVDEYGEDDDEDMSAVDLDGLVGLFDEKSHTNHPQMDNMRLPQANVQEPDSKDLDLHPPMDYQRNRVAEGEFVKDVLDNSSDEEFGDEADFEDMIAECTATTASLLENSSRRQRTTIPRYRIMNIIDGDFETERGRRQPEKLLLVQEEKSKTSKVIILRQSWIHSQCSPGSFVHVVGTFGKTGQCIVDDVKNFIVLHPDHLISATVVGDSFSCTRRAVLQDRIKATSDSNEAQIYGHVLHEIFQEAMQANRWDDTWLHRCIEKVASRYLESFFEINLDPLKAVEQLKSKAVALQSWAEVFVAARPRAEAVVKERNGAQVSLSVNKLIEIEEKVWSPMYGLKGNVDATVQISVNDGKAERTLTVPFELKTGKHANAAHKAQTALYTLLLSDRYDIDVACGILYYMESSESSRIPAIRHELMHLVMQRNELASFVRHRLDLPPMLKSAHLCGRCYAQTPCFVYHSLVEGGNGNTSGMHEKFDEIVQHLTPCHADFYRKWDDLLTKEEKDIVKFRRELWTMQSTDREKLGRCFSNVIIEPGSTNEVEGSSKINRFRYAFIKKTLIPGFSFTQSQLTTGEPIVISDEQGHFALANGYVTAIQKRRIEVAVDRRLSDSRSRRTDFDPKQNQNFVGIMEVVEAKEHLKSAIEQPAESMCYRIDKDEFSNGMATVRNNLICLMEKDLFGSQALRKLIIENVAPTFRPKANNFSLGDSASQTDLNIDQRNAIEKIMTAKDYALVLGMPGTGKTTTIAHIISALIAQGKSVLLTSYTHTAVDNILLKIRKDKIGIFRLGAVTKVHPEVQKFADLAGVPMESIEQIKRAYSQPVVATTCLGVNHPIFNQKVFDYCIVDEASQITLPVCLGPIRMARTFILVGDHYQLPPLVQNKEAQQGGLDISLFKMLSDNQPISVVNLEHQYRMCEDIMTLSNTLIYKGLLKCGNTAVAQRSLHIPNLGALKQHHHTPATLISSSVNPKTICLNPSRRSCWIRDLLDPGAKARLVNTDALLPLSRESESGSRIINTCEATLCTQLVESLLSVGISANDIGVITLYRSQLALIKQNLRHHHPAVEMHTADKFQGRDKEVVILSLVRSNESLNIGDLLKDWRRVNVALTRARTKLLILGSKSTLKGNELLERFVKLMDERRWSYDLPASALEGHVFDEHMTPLTAKTDIAASSSAQVSPKKKIAPKRIEIFFEKRRGKENKLPGKVGKKTEKALLGSRPVLRDIVNDAS